MLSKKELFESIKTSGIGKYYDKFTGRFFIPVNELNTSVTEAVIECLKNGYGLSANRPDDELMYTLFSIKDDTKGSRELSVCRDMLYSLLHDDCGVHYFTKMSFKQYGSVVKYQEAIDYVLENGAEFDNMVEDWCIVLVCEDDCFKFIEVLEPFV